MTFVKEKQYMTCSYAGVDSPVQLIHSFTDVALFKQALNGVQRGPPEDPITNAIKDSIRVEALINEVNAEERLNDADASASSSASLGVASTSFSFSALMNCSQRHIKFQHLCW
jgi:hypothetical protein